MLTCYNPLILMPAKTAAFPAVTATASGSTAAGSRAPLCASLADAA